MSETQRAYARAMAPSQIQGVFGAYPFSFAQSRAYIKKLEQLLQLGYDAQHPLLLTAYPDGRFVIDGGHHRLQAIRNLMWFGIYPRNFQAPVLVRFWKTQFQK